MNDNLDRRCFLGLAMGSLVADAAVNAGAVSGSTGQQQRMTTISIKEDMFFINGQPTYKGRSWNGQRIEGLLYNVRMVQGIFDDLNPETVSKWTYPDTGRWDPERNNREFLAAMPAWRDHGVLGITVNLQGGRPIIRTHNRQPWDNSAITGSGELKHDYMVRLQKILDFADELGMVVILGIFYFGQDQRIKSEAAIKRAVDNTVDWVLERGYTNVIIEVDNECDVEDYDHEILKPKRVHELIERVKNRTRDGKRLLVSTSYRGTAVPLENVVRSADYLLLHGNGVKRPERLARMVQETRSVPGYHPMPILVNEDPNLDFDKPRNNLLAATGEYCSWGYYEKGSSNYRDGFQCPPVDWRINTENKKAFFNMVKEITGV